MKNYYMNMDRMKENCNNNASRTSWETSDDDGGGKIIKSDQTEDCYGTKIQLMIW